MVLLSALLGLVVNLGFSGEFIQPDWSLALMLGALLAHRGNWVWIAPAMWLHDLVLHWSSLVALPWILLAPWLIAWSDAQIGPNLMQRIVVMLMVVLPLFWWGWSVYACILTLLLSLVCWYWMARLYAQPA